MVLAKFVLFSIHSGAWRGWGGVRGRGEADVGEGRYCLPMPSRCWLSFQPSRSDLPISAARDAITLASHQK